MLSTTISLFGTAAFICDYDDRTTEYGLYSLFQPMFSGDRTGNATNASHMETSIPLHDPAVSATPVTRA